MNPMETYCSQMLAVDLQTPGTVYSHYDINTGGLPAGAGYGIRKCTVYNDHIALIKLFDISNTVYTITYNGNWLSWHSTNTQVIDLAGNGSFMVYTKDDICYVNINGYTNGIAGYGYCGVGDALKPASEVCVPVTIPGDGVGMLIINTSGNGALYSADLNTYKSGSIKATFCYKIAK